MKKFLIAGLIFAPFHVIAVLLISAIDTSGEYLLAYFVLGVGMFLAIYLNMDKFIKLKKENKK